MAPKDDSRRLISWISEGAAHISDVPAPEQAHDRLGQVRGHLKPIRQGLGLGRVFEPDRRVPVDIVDALVGGQRSCSRRDGSRHRARRVLGAGLGGAFACMRACMSACVYMCMQAFGYMSGCMIELVLSLIHTCICIRLCTCLRPLQRAASDKDRTHEVWLLVHLELFVPLHCRGGYPERCGEIRRWRHEFAVQRGLYSRRAWAVEAGGCFVPGRSTLEGGGIGETGRTACVRHLDAPVILQPCSGEDSFMGLLTQVTNGVE